QNAKTVGENDVALVVVRRDALGVGRAARRIEGEDRDLTALLGEEAVVEKARLREREADAAARRAVTDIGKLMPADRGMQRHARHLGAIGVVQEHRPGHLRIVPFGGAGHREEAVDVELEQAGRRRGEILLAPLAPGRNRKTLLEGKRAVVALAEQKQALRPGAARRLAD